MARSRRSAWRLGRRRVTVTRLGLRRDVAGAQSPPRVGAGRCVRTASKAALTGQSSKATSACCGGPTLHPPDRDRPARGRPDQRSYSTTTPQIRQRVQQGSIALFTDTVTASVALSRVRRRPRRARPSTLASPDGWVPWLAAQRQPRHSCVERGGGGAGPPPPPPPRWRGIRGCSLRSQPTAPDPDRILQGSRRPVPWAAASPAHAVCRGAGGDREHRGAEPSVPPAPRQ